MAAGEVYLFHRPTTLKSFRSDPFGTTMTALIHLTTGSRWNHAALGIGPDENGTEMMVEATSKGIAVNPVRSSDEIRVIPMCLDERADLCAGSHALPVMARYWGPKTLEAVLAWNTARVGWKYGYLNAAICGLRSMWPGLQLKVGQQAICSEIVAESLERAGHDWGKDSALVSPGDVATHFGVER